MVSDSSLDGHESANAGKQGVTHRRSCIPHVGSRDRCCWLCKRLSSQPTLGRNTHVVNNTCTSNYASQFNGYVSCLWSHEGAHLSGALASAATSLNDLHEVWEPRVRSSEDLLRDEDIRLDAQYVEGRINTDAYNAAHNLPQQSYSFWRFQVASGWQADTQTPRCSS